MRELFAGCTCNLNILFIDNDACLDCIVMRFDWSKTSSAEVHFSPLFEYQFQAQGLTVVEAAQKSPEKPFCANLIVRLKSAYDLCGNYVDYLWRTM